MTVFVFPEGRRNIYFYWQFISSESYVKKYKFIKPINVLWVSKNEHAGIYFISDDYNEQYRDLLKYFLKNRKALSDFIKFIKGRESELLKIKLNNVKNLTNKQLYRLYKKFYNTYIKMFKPISIVRQLDRVGTDKLKKILVNKKIKNIEEKVSTLLTTEKELYYAKERKELLRLAIIVKKMFGNNLDAIKNSEFVKSKIHQIWKNHLWVPISWYNEQARTEKYYWEELLGFTSSDPKIELGTLKQNKRDKTLDRNKLINRLDLENKEKILIKILQECVFLKDYTKGIFSRSILNSDKVFDEISRRTNLKSNEVRALTLKETEGILVNDRKPDISLIKKRLHYCVIFAQPNKTLKIFYGKDAEKMESKYLKNALQSNILEFRGRSVLKGFGKGKARIIFTSEDLEEFKENEVLIANNTTPNFVPAMKKAAAIVTEEGGVTCHAAIVSRELGIPAVVGVENATNAFKNGDVLEVDATNGVVKIIKRKHNKNIYKQTENI